MSSSTTGGGSGVPMTNGFSPFVPSPGVEIWREVRSNGGTAEQPATFEKVYPLPDTSFNRQNVTK